ncbi:MAG: hypothetical protein K1X29_05345 [Bdellovibrionales bacterium]|nr:hypothetical protein [Bdellovibrionales bacterium]
MIDLHLLAFKLNKKTQHSLADWKTILQKTIHDPAFAQMTDGEIQQLTDSVQSPHQLKWMCEIFSESLKSRPHELPFDFLLKHVAAANYSLEDWLEALFLLSKKLGFDEKTKDIYILLDAFAKRIDFSINKKKPRFNSLTEAVKQVI